MWIVYIPPLIYIESSPIFEQLFCLNLQDIVCHAGIQVWMDAVL